MVLDTLSKLYRETKVDGGKENILNALYGNIVSLDSFSNYSNRLFTEVPEIYYVTLIEISNTFKIKLRKVYTLD